jgi:hypothetical protein
MKNLSEKIEKSFRYPIYGGKSKYKPVLLGTLMIFFSFLVIPIFIFSGYMLEVLRASINDEDRPEFTDFKNLFIEGVKYVIVVLPITIASLCVFGISYLVLPFYFYNILSLVGGPILTILTIPVIGLYAKTGSFSGAYQVDKVLEIAKDKDFVVSIIIFYLIASAGGMAIAFISLFTLFIGFPFFMTYFQIFSITLMGKILQPYLQEENKHSSQSTHQPRTR